MPHFKLTFEILQYWHCGTGAGGEGDVDATPITEPSGLPYIPGKHIKGLLREAARFAKQEGFTDADLETHWFGVRTSNAGQTETSGLIHVANAKMNGPFADYARSFHAANGHPCPESTALFETLRQTALKDGIALDKSLRSIRCTVSTTLETIVEIEAEAEKDLTLLCKLVRAVGHARNDGLGRCKVTCVRSEEGAAKTTNSVANSSTSRLVELTLIDDVIVSAASGTSGGHRCLDHIPGSAMLGIAAAHCYGPLKGAGKAIDVFHAGKVRFGSAYPVTGKSESIPAPASWHFGKDEKSAAPKCRATDPEALGSSQPKQLREGFVSDGTLVKPVTGYRLKTAIDPDSGTAEEAKLFGFAYLPAGMRFIARLDADDADSLSLVLGAFDGRQIRIGRSRRNEFGRATAKLVDAKSSDESPKGGTTFSILAESDLALVTPQGFPATSPEQISLALGLPDAPDTADNWKIDPTRTFLRTRRYSPWNAHRKGFGPERTVIRAGSVITCIGNTSFTPSNKPVGRFQAEGLGRIRWTLPEVPEKLETSDGLPKISGGAGKVDESDRIVQRHARMGFDARALQLAQTWSKEWLGFHASLGPSQWSRLRQAAASAKDLNALIAALDDQKKGIFHHGRMAKKWQKEKGRGATLSATILKNLGSDSKDASLRLAACREAARLTAAAMSKQNH